MAVSEAKGLRKTVESLTFGDGRAVTLPEALTMAKKPDVPAEPQNDYGVPISCDVFERSPESIEEAEARGVDPVIVFVRVHRVGSNGKRGPRITNGRDSQWTPDGVNVSWLLDTFGPGHYDCVGVNSSGMVIAMGRVEVANPEDSHVPTNPAMPETGGTAHPAPPGWPPGYPPPSAYPWYPPQPAPRPEPLREAVAAMAELITLDIQRSRLAVEAQTAKTGTEKQLVDALVAIAARAPEKSSGQGPGAPGIETLLSILKFGMTLGARSNGKAGAEGVEPDETAWRTIVPQIVDSIGPGAIATLAQLFPKDKADAVLRLLEQHMTTRKAEAEADVAGAPVDVPGETVTP